MATGRPKKPESGSTKNIFTLFFCYRESFDKENQEEEGRTGPRLYTTTFVPRIRNRSNKVTPYASVVDPDRSCWIRNFLAESDPDPRIWPSWPEFSHFLQMVLFVFDYLHISSVLRIRIRTYSKKKIFHIIEESMCTVYEQKVQNAGNYLLSIS